MPEDDESDNGFFSSFLAFLAFFDDSISWFSLSSGSFYRANIIRFCFSRGLTRPRSAAMSLISPFFFFFSFTSLGSTILLEMSIKDLLFDAPAFLSIFLMAYESS